MFRYCRKLVQTCGTLVENGGCSHGCAVGRCIILQAGQCLIQQRQRQRQRTLLPSRPRRETRCEASHNSAAQHGSLRRWRPWPTLCTHRTSAICRLPQPERMRPRCLSSGGNRLPSPPSSSEESDVRYPAARLAMRSCRCRLSLLSRVAMLTNLAAGLRASGGRPCKPRHGQPSLATHEATLVKCQCIIYPAGRRTSPENAACSTRRATSSPLAVPCLGASSASHARVLITAHSMSLLAAHHAHSSSHAQAPCMHSSSGAQGCSQVITVHLAAVRTTRLVLKVFQRLQQCAAHIQAEAL